MWTGNGSHTLDAFFASVNPDNRCYGPGSADNGAGPSRGELLSEP